MKKKLVFGTMLVCLLALSFAVMGCATSDTLSKENRGIFQNITVPNKDFQSLGLVFSEVSFDTDDKGSRGDVFTYNALLKEAKELGADYIINVVIDVKKVGVHKWFKMFRSKRDMGIVSEKETWYGSATAIKYTEALTSDATSNAAASNTTTNIAGGTASVKKWWNPLTWFKK
jgi:hypothetical protein